MGKSIFAFLLSFAIGIQPFALYPLPAYAEDKAVETPDAPTELQTLLIKIRETKANYERHKIYGDTPGSKPELVPSASQITALDQEVQTFKEKLFSEISDTLSNPSIIANRDPKKFPREWSDLMLFYTMASELENLLSITGSAPNPASWEKKYAFEVPLDKIYLAAFIQHIGFYNRAMDLSKANRFDFFVRLHDRNKESSIYKFTLNPLLAVAMAENVIAAKADKTQMLRLAQMVAADQLYTSQVIAHNFIQKDYSPLPELNPVLKAKFPILEWRRRGYKIVGDLEDQRTMIHELAEKKVAALVEKLNNEQRFLMNLETMKKILTVIDPDAAAGPDEKIQEFVDGIVKDEKERPMIQTLQSILYSTKFDPADSKSFWRHYIKDAIAQAKVAVATEMMLNVPGRSEVEREKVRKILQVRAYEFATQDLNNFEVDKILKYIKDAPTLYAERRFNFQKTLWQASREMENELAVENANVDLTIIADPDFVEALNSSINKVETKYQVSTDPLNGLTDATFTHTTSTNIRPLTFQWLQKTFQPNKSYRQLKALYIQLLNESLSEFNSGQPDPNDAFGTVFGPSSSALQKWVMAGTYNSKAVSIDENNPLNFLAINLKNIAPRERKQELIELIKIAENLGFFTKNLPANPKVRDLAWDADWKKAYLAVKRKRTIAQNPILAMKMNDTEKESMWASVAYFGPRLLGFYKDGQTFAEQLAPLYTNGTEKPDDRADQLVSDYLAKLQDLIQKNLDYLANVETVEQKAQWNSPTTWRNAFFDNPKPEFTPEFKKIISYSFILVSKLSEYTRFQKLYVRMLDEFAEGDVYGKAYDRLYNYYVTYAFMAVLGFGILKAFTRYVNPFKDTRAFEFLKAVETEALTPILGPNLKYFSLAAIIWMVVEASGNAYDTFYLARGLRNEISDFALSSAIGSGLIDMNAKVKYGDGGYNDARMHWWTTDGLLVLLGGGLLIGYPTYLVTSKVMRARKTTAWLQRIKYLTDEIGMQAPKADGGRIVYLTKGDIDANANATIREVTERFAASEKTASLDPQAIHNKLDLPKKLARIEQARLALHAEMDTLAAEWATYGQKFAHQFRTLEMSPGQWDIILFTQREKDIKEALRIGKISREQYWQLRQNLTELTQFLDGYIKTFKSHPGFKEAIVEKLATSASRLQFDEAGQIIKFDKNAVPEAWKQGIRSVNSQDITRFQKVSDDLLFEFLGSREMNMFIRFNKNYKGVSYAERIKPTIQNKDGSIKETHFYNMLPRSPLQEQFLQGLVK